MRTSGKILMVFSGLASRRKEVNEMRRKGKGLFMRGGKWWMRFTGPNGVERKRSTSVDVRGREEEKAAEAVLAKVKVMIAEGKWLDFDQAKNHTYDEMIGRFMKVHAHTVAEKARKSYRNSQAHLGEFFLGLTLDKIDQDLIMQYVTHRRNAGDAQP